MLQNKEHRTMEECRGPKRKTQNVPLFLQKLFTIINSNESSNAICWNSDGMSFTVVNKDLFTHFVLPKHFKHRNMNSFVRQLNMYDFHKCKRSTQDISFAHPYFIRDREDLLVKIKRKTNSSYVDFQKNQQMQMSEKVMGQEVLGSMQNQISNQSNRMQNELN